MADGDGSVAQIAGSLVAHIVEAKCIIHSDFPGAFQEEKFVTERARGKIAQAVEIQAEAVKGFHSEGRMFADVIGILNPTNELMVKLFETVNMAEIADEKLVSDCAEEPLDLALGGTIPDGCMNQYSCETGADHRKLLRTIIRTIVHINGLWNTTLVESCLEAIDKVGSVVSSVKSAVRHDAGSVVDKADEEGFDGSIDTVFEVGPVQGITLPEIVGMRLGKSQSCLAAVVIDGFEELEAVDNQAKCRGPDPRALE